MIILLFIFIPDTSANTIQTDKAGETITFQVKTPFNTQECYITGNFNNWNLSESYKCIKTDSITFSITLNDSLWIDGVNLSNLKYLFLKCPCDWSCVEKGKQGEYINERVYQTGKTDTVIKWNDIQMSYEIPIKVKTPPNTKECYMIGDFNNTNSPLEYYKLDKYGIGTNDTVIFATQLVYVICKDNLTKFIFSCGQSPNSIQSDPANEFNIDGRNYYVVKSWMSDPVGTTNENNKPQAIIKQDNKTLKVQFNNSDNYDVNIFSIDGRKLFHNTYKSIDQIKINISFMPIGNYIIKLNNQSYKLNLIK